MCIPDTGESVSESALCSLRMFFNFLWGSCWIGEEEAVRFLEPTLLGAEEMGSGVTFSWTLSERSSGTSWTGAGWNIDLNIPVHIDISYFGTRQLTKKIKEIRMLANQLELKLIEQLLLLS